jgi:hypothetical protein
LIKVAEHVQPLHKSRTLALLLLNTYQYHAHAFPAADAGLLAAAMPSCQPYNFLQLELKDYFSETFFFGRDQENVLKEMSI